MRQVWNVLLSLADGEVLLAHVSGPIAPGVRPRATVRKAPSERATFMALVDADDRTEAIAAADALRGRYLVDGLLS